MSIYREMRSPFCRCFSDLSNFKTETLGLQNLLQNPAFPERVREITDLMKLASVEARYRRFVSELTGGVYPLEFGVGAWMDRLSGKEIFRSIVGPCFRVESSSGDVLQGNDQYNAIARDILKLPLMQQPEDFKGIVELLQLRLQDLT